MDTVLDLIGGLRFGVPQRAGALTLVPVHHDEPGADYVLFADAAASGLASVEEASGPDPVGNLLVRNRAETPVLLVEGEVVVGMKQNRTLNTTVLVPVRAEVVIPVSCVEQGRWGHRTDYGARDEYHLSPRVREAKAAGVQRSVRSGSGYRSSQSEVWERVGEVLAHHEAASPTGSYSEVNLQRAGDIRRLLEGLSPEPGQRGVLAVVGLRPAALDVFDRADTMAALWEPLVGSYAADALLETGQAEERHVKEAIDWVRDLASGEATTHPGVGAGRVVQLSGRLGVASALMADRAVVHLASLWRRPSQIQSTMRRPSSRRSWPMEGRA